MTFQMYLRSEIVFGDGRCQAFNQARVPGEVTWDQL